MAGSVLWVIGPTGFIAGFVISEIISHLSTLTMEDWHMVKKAIHEVMAYVKSFPSRFITSLEAHLPSRQSLLKSL